MEKKIKQYICDKYTFYWSTSKKLEEQIRKDIGDSAYRVPICAWNYLCSYYDDNGDMSNIVAEVLYMEPAVYEQEKKRTGNKSVI